MVSISNHLGWNCQNRLRFLRLCTMRTREEIISHRGGGIILVQARGILGKRLSKQRAYRTRGNLRSTS
jgi:hypothetical protein